MSENLYFPAYFKDWNAIKEAVTAEQGWKLFKACLDYAEHNIPFKDNDPVLNAFFMLLSGGIDRSQTKQSEKSRRGRYARYCQECDKNGIERLSFEEWTEQIDKCQQMPANANGRDNHNRNPIGIEIQSKSETKPTQFPTQKKKYGVYGWVRLTDEQYNKLLADLGEAELERCIQYIDESAETTGNKNHWKNWNLVIRRCSRDGWGKKQFAASTESYRPEEKLVAWNIGNS